jgi:hypothetical protein
MKNAEMWLKANYRKLKDVEFSPLGVQVAQFLEEMWGLHHLDGDRLKVMDWGNDHHLIYVHDRSMSTVDDANLTKLVVLAHQKMLRVCVSGYKPRHLELMFHQRSSRKIQGGLPYWCPTIEEHVASIVKYHPAVDEVTQ